MDRLRSTDFRFLWTETMKTNLHKLKKGKRARKKIEARKLDRRWRWRY